MWIVVGVILAATLIVAIVIWRRPPVDPLPPPVRTAVDHEKADRARVDSQLIAASLEAFAAQQRQARAEAQTDSLRSVARRFSVYADSLAQRASSAVNAHDSATYYREAYEVRTDERDTLLAALASERRALGAANDRIASLAKDTTIANRARQRADSVLDAVVASVTVCTVPWTFGRVKCPSRKTAFALGNVGGLATEEIYRAAKDGRISISLPFLR